METPLLGIDTRTMKKFLLLVLAVLAALLVLKVVIAVVSALIGIAVFAGVVAAVWFGGMALYRHLSREHPSA